MIFFHKEDVDFYFKNHRIISSWIKQVLLSENKKLRELNFIFCSDEYLLQINKEFLQHDFYTDIISFDHSEDDYIEGDIFISIDRVKENSTNFNIEFSFELHRIIIHGVLHLIGYDDKSFFDKNLMNSKEDFYLSLLNSSSST